MKGIRIRINNCSNALKYEHELAGDLVLSDRAKRYTGTANQTYWGIHNKYAGKNESSSIIFEIVPTEPDMKNGAEIVLLGKLDSDSSDELEAALDWILVEPVETVILDLSDVIFITRSGISVLIRTNRKLARRNVNLLLTKLQPQILKVLKIFNELPRTSLFRSRQEMDDYLTAMQSKDN